MPGLLPIPIELAAPHRQQLEAIVRKQTNPQHVVKRARIILFADQGVGLTDTARRLGVSVTMVAWWRRRWRASDLGDAQARLMDAPRSGAPATYTPEQICAIVALACEDPADSGRPISHWTQQEIADEAIHRGLVGWISQRSVGRFLKRGCVAAAPHSRLAERQAG